MIVAENVKKTKPTWLNRALQKRKGSKTIGRSEKIEGLLMTAIPFIGFLLFTAFPIALTIVVSFFDLHSYDLSSMTWVGLDNYKQMFADPLFKDAVKNTFYYMLSVPINLVSQLFIANLLSKPLNKTFKKVARLVLYIPTIIGAVAVALVWNWILEPEYGVFNTILTAMGLPKIGFTTTYEWFMPSVLLIRWWSAGLNVLIFESALSNVDNTLKEAARIDGASERRVFFSVTIPQIAPMMLYTLMTETIGAFQEMSVMQIISGNGVGPSNAAVTLSYLMYRMAYVHVYTEGFGMASALGFFLGIIVIVISVTINFISKKLFSYD